MIVTTHRAQIHIIFTGVTLDGTQTPCRVGFPSFSGTIQKKSAEIREKMFKDLDPEDRQVMMKVTGKINMLQMGQIMGFAGDGRQDLAIKMLKEAGISDEDISKFFAAGMHMMQKMQKQAKK